MRFSKSMTDTYSTKIPSPVLDSMEQGRVSPPLSSPDTERYTMPSTQPNTLEEGYGYRPSNPSPYSATFNPPSVDPNENPTFWQKMKRTFGLGGKRRKSRKLRKSKKSRKVRKNRKTKKTHKSLKKRHLSRKRGGTTQKVWIAQGKTPNGQYGGINNHIAVKPYEPPMDFAPVHGIPTAKPHTLVG